MPSIIIQQAVTNVDILIEPIVNTYTVLISEMQMPGISAYQVAVNNGFVGTEAEWLASFKNHLLLTNIGVKTHAQIDIDLTRLADTSGINTGDQDLSGKVDKVTGYSLTKNDLTDILKTAYDNVVSWVSTNGTNLINHLSNITNPHSVTKAQVGLGSVDDTSDANKPVSTAQQTALNLKVDNSLLGAVNGVAQLDASGFVKNTQLPSYVDDVLEFTNLEGFPLTGESGKIYIALDTNKTYRWSGTVYAIISETITIGEVKADTEIASAISLKHAQGSDIQDLSPYELLTNKKTDIEANKTSNTFFASIKAIYDWTKTQTIENITLLPANWTLVSGLYEYNYANAAILADSIIEIIPYNSTIETVRQAEVLPMVISAAGTVKLYAKYLPAANILIALNIQK